MVSGKTSSSAEILSSDSKEVVSSMGKVVPKFFFKLLGLTSVEMEVKIELRPNGQSPLWKIDVGEW